jgi:uncharacterized protein (UPF0332 family)
LQGGIIANNLPVLMSSFGKEFVKTGLFDKKFHQYVLNTFDLRNSGDYGAMHAVPEDKAK